MRPHTWKRRGVLWSIAGTILLLALATVPSLAHPSPPPAQHSTALFQATGTLVVTVFHDLNQNHVQDAGEPGLSGVNVKVFLVSDGVSGPIATSTTGGDGKATFTGLNPAQYRVEIEPLASYAAIAGKTRLVTVLGGLETNIAFPLAQIQTPTPGPSPTQGATPTIAPTFTPTPTPPPTNTPLPTDTPLVSPTPTGSATPTPTQTATPTPTGTLFPITPILITTTPGVYVTVTPSGPVYRLPDTGGGGMPLMWAVGFGLLMLAAAGLRRLFREA